MALKLKPDYTVSQSGQSVFVKEIVGAYSEENDGGWGNPNPEMNESCVFAAVVRTASTGEEYLLPKGNDLVYDPLAENSKITTFEFGYKNDGGHIFYVGRLPVSDDGINYINAGGLISEADFFYWAGKVWQLIEGVAEEKEISDLIGDPSVAQGTCDDFIVAQLAVQKQILYKEYRKNREPNPDDAEPIFQELLKLREDIQGAVYAYYSGLKVEAQDQVESSLDKYQLTYR